MKLKTLLAVVLPGLAIALFLWVRPTAKDYANFPPAATGPWVAFGDSLTEGVGASTGHDYPSLLGRRLGIEIQNFGRSGNTTSDGLARMEEVANLRPRVVLLCLGGNDALSQVPMNQALLNLEKIIDRFQAEGSFVVLIGIRSASLRDRNEKQFARVARKKRVAYLPDMLDGLAFRPVYMSDAIHPNDQGYERIAVRLEKLLKPLLSELVSALNPLLRPPRLFGMGKAKVAATGSGYVGEVMVHRISAQVGVVESVVEAKDGWPPTISLKLKDGALKKGRLSDFREASGEEKKKFTETQPDSAKAAS